MAHSLLRITRTLRRLAAVSAIIGLGAAAARAANEAAIVEDINAPGAGVDLMDYLSVGQMVRLGAGQTIVIDYLRSCLRETISGGTITIGSEQSLVDGGTINREKVECDGGKMILTSEQASKSGIVVFRKVMPQGAAPVTLYGASPIIDVKAGGKVVIERLDQPGESRVVTIATGKKHPAPYDFAKNNLALTPGGTYRATSGEREIIFKVAPTAKPGATALVGRLLRF